MAIVPDDPAPNGLFGVESILPVQFWGLSQVPGRGEAERRLMLAVLQDALMTLVGHAGGRSRKRSRLVADARRWFASDARSHPFAFGAICDALGLDVSYIRAALRRLQARRENGSPYRRDYAGRGRHQVERLSRRVKS